MFRFIFITLLLISLNAKAQVDSTVHIIALEDVEINNSTIKYGYFSNISKKHHAIKFKSQNASLDRTIIPFALSFQNPYEDSAIYLDSVYISGTNIDSHYTQVSLLLLQNGQVQDTIKLEKQSYRKGINAYITDALTQLPMKRFLVVLFLESKANYPSFTLYHTKNHHFPRVTIDKAGMYKEYFDHEDWGYFPQMKLVFRIAS